MYMQRKVSHRSLKQFPTTCSVYVLCKKGTRKILSTILPSNEELYAKLVQ